jgi:hypothetical protein
MGDDRADGGVDGAAGNGATSVDKIGGEGVLDPKAVVDGAHGRDAVRETRRLGEVLGEADSGDGGINRGVV